MKLYDVCLWKLPASSEAEVQTMQFAESAEEAVFGVMRTYGLLWVNLGWAASNDDDEVDFVCLVGPRVAERGGEVQQ